MNDKIKQLPDGEPLAKRPVRYDANGSYFLNSDGQMFLQLRGWGYLTGVGGLHLTDDEALQIQDAVGSYIAKCINDHARLVSELDRKTRALEDREKFFRWAYALLVELGVVELERMNAERENERDWPAGQEWDDINGSSRSIFLRAARQRAGIDHDEFLAVVRSGEFNVDDLYARKWLDGE